MMASDTPSQPARRRRVLASLLGAPAILTIAGVIGLEGWRIARPQSDLFTTPFVYSLAEAIERDDVQRAYEFVRAGQDPDAPITVRHPVLTGGRPVAVPPLLWAVAVNSRESVLMLLGFGAQLDGPVAHRAVCLADALGHADMATVLTIHGPQLSRGACAERRDVGSPLLSTAGPAPPGS